MEEAGGGQGDLGRGGRGSGEERASWGASSLGVKGRGPARRGAKEAAGKRQNPVRNPVWLGGQGRHWDRLLH